MATEEQDDWIEGVGGVHPSRFAAGAPPAGKGMLDEAWDWTKGKASQAGHAIGAFDDRHGHVLTRAAGAAQMLGGTAEALAGAGVAGLGGTATATGVGAAPGIPAMVGGTALAVNGVDNAQTGLRTLITGEFHHTAISEAAGAGARALGASEQTVSRITNGVDLTQGLAGGAGSIAAGMARKGAGEAIKISSTVGRAGRAAEEGEDAAKLLAKTADVPHPPPVVLSGKALKLSEALRDAPKGSPERAKLIEEFTQLSTHSKPPPTRVVLGKWEEVGKGGYVDETNAKGGVWYETPPGSYAVMKEAAWETNVAFLRKQMESGIPRLEFTNIRISEELASAAKNSAQAAAKGQVFVPPARVKEILFLQENAARYGYQQVGDAFVKTH